MRHLVETGQRPSRLASMTLAELETLVQEHMPEPDAVAPARSALHAACMELIKAHDPVGLNRKLDDACARMGLQSFITELVAPLTTAVGDAWMRGRFAIFQEHLFSEALQVTLRAATARLPEPLPGARPRVLLTTFVGEPHGLGLLMAQALLALEGAQCISLGVETPVWDIAQAATALRCDIVALSFTGAMNPSALVEGLRELRGHLPAKTELWAGGSAPALHRRPMPGVLALSTLEQLQDPLRQWRAARR